MSTQETEKSIHQDGIETQYLGTQVPVLDFRPIQTQSKTNRRNINLQEVSP